MPTPPTTTTLHPIVLADDTPLTESQPYVQLSRNSDDVGIGVNGAAREKDVGM